jgi:phospholipase C
VDPRLAAEGYDQNDEHPPAIAMIGQALVASVVDALTRSPNWSRSALFLTYDEHGGLYDHVVPPKACVPDDIAPELDPNDPNASFDPKAAFDTLGIRVPMMLVSPYAKKHFVGHEVYDHTSITRFVEARFVLPALSNRDANAEAPWEMFDFDNAPHATPPAIPLPAVDTAKESACAKIFVP